MPLLSTNNCFNILSNICDSETILPDVQNSETIPILTPVLTVLIPKVRKLKWEKALPASYTIATTEGSPTLLKVKVEIETINTVEKKLVTSLIDSDATGKFIDRHYTKSC